MSKEPKAARADKAAPAKAPPEADPEILLRDPDRPADRPPTITVVRADGSVWIDLKAERERMKVLEELFNVALGRAPDSTRSLIDQTTATPKVTKVRDAAHLMADRLAARGFEIVRRG